jgi:2-dehydro-3-deoxygluconokinase
MAAARVAGTVVSYDLNFRSKLWTSERAMAVTRGLMPFIDVLIGNEEDFQKSLGLRIEGTDDRLRTLPVESYKKMAARLFESYSHLKAVGTSLREVVSGCVNNWSAILALEGTVYESRRFEGLEVEDRVGGGAAHGALLQSTRGDTSMVTLDEVRHVLKGGGARIQR